MGSACSDKGSIDAAHPGHQVVPAINIEKEKIEQLRFKKSLIFQSEGSESTFLDLSTPRSGTLIKWRIGDLIGEGAYAKVFQCLNLKTGELMAVKQFVVIHN